MKLNKTILALIIVFTIVACEEQQVAVEQTATSELIGNDVFMKDNVVTFRNMDYYISFVEGVKNEDKKKSLVGKIKDVTGYVPYYKTLQKARPGISSRSEDEISFLEEDDFITTLLNNDGIIEIGPYVFKVNLLTERVYVLESIYKEELMGELIAENDHPMIQVFSTNDEVLTMLQNGEKSNIASRTEGCDEVPAIGYDRATISIHSDTNWTFRLDGFHKYTKAGIYYSLVAKAETCYKLIDEEDKDYVAYKTTLGINWNDCLWWKKCGQRYDNVTGGTSLAATSFIKQRHYESATKRLSKYYLETEFAWYANGTWIWASPDDIFDLDPLN